MIPLLVGYGALAAGTYICTMLYEDVPLEKIEAKKVVKAAAVGAVAGCLACKAVEYVAEKAIAQNATEERLMALEKEFAEYKRSTDFSITSLSSDVQEALDTAQDVDRNMQDLVATVFY